MSGKAVTNLVYTAITGVTSWMVWENPVAVAIILAAWAIAMTINNL